MLKLAEAAGTSLGLTYRYFKGKDALVLQLYRETTASFVAQIPALPAGTVADRLRAALELKIALCAPHRRVFAAVIPTTLSPQSEAFALGKDASDVRTAVTRPYADVIRSGSGPPGLPPGERAPIRCLAGAATIRRRGTGYEDTDGLPAVDGRQRPCR